MHISGSRRNLQAPAIHMPQGVGHILLSQQHFSALTNFPDQLWGCRVSIYNWLPFGSLEKRRNCRGSHQLARYTYFVHPSTAVKCQMRQCEAVADNGPRSLGRDVAAERGDVAKRLQHIYYGRITGLKC